MRTVTLYHVALHSEWRGVPKVMEPEKNAGWKWFSMDNLPSPLFPGLGGAIERLSDQHG